MVELDTHKSKHMTTHSYLHHNLLLEIPLQKRSNVVFWQ